MFRNNFFKNQRVGRRGGSPKEESIGDTLMSNSDSEKNSEKNTINSVMEPVLDKKKALIVEAPVSEASDATSVMNTSDNQVDTVSNTSYLSMSLNTDVADDTFCPMCEKLLLDFKNASQGDSYKMSNFIMRCYDCRDKDNNTIVHYMIKCAEKNEICKKIVEYMAKQIPKRHKILNDQNDEGKTILFAAGEAKLHDLVTFLYSIGAINMPTKEGNVLQTDNDASVTETVNTDGSRSISIAFKPRNISKLSDVISTIQKNSEASQASDTIPQASDTSQASDMIPQDRTIAVNTGGKKSKGKQSKEKKSKGKKSNVKKTTSGSRKLKMNSVNTESSNMDSAKSSKSSISSKDNALSRMINNKKSQMHDKFLSKIKSMLNDKLITINNKLIMDENDNAEIIKRFLYGEITKENNQLSGFDKITILNKMSDDELVDMIKRIKDYKELVSLNKDIKKNRDEKKASSETEQNEKKK